jgi:NTF2 fold immunity protein
MEGNVPVWWPISGLDLIPDAETALKIGRVILERYYGDSLVRRYEPYLVSPDPINAENWVVSGSREDKSAAGFGGGFPELSIARRDARVTRIALSK